MAQTGRVNAGGIEIAYQRAGEGAPLICLHGIGGNAGQFRQQREGLSDEFTVIAWDAPGYGQSSDPGGDWTMAQYADCLAGLMDGLSIDRANILGQSWGGVLALEFYRRHRGRIRSLILSDTYPGGGAREPAEREASLRARLQALETMTPEEMARARAPEVLSPEPDPDVLREVEAMLAQIRPVGYRVAAVSLAQADERDVLGTIAVPTLIVAGEFDRVVDREWASKMGDAIAGARLEVVRGAGHLPNQERPAAYNALVRDFLRAVASGSPGT